jgi:hypothetical protein
MKNPLLCFSNCNGNYQTLLTQLIDINHLFEAVRTPEGHHQLIPQPTTSTLVILGNWLPKKKSKTIIWRDLELICKLLLKLKHHLILICGRREYEFTLQAWKGKPYFTKHSTPTDFFEHVWMPLMQTTHLYYIHETEYLISYAPLTSQLITNMDPYQKQATAKSSTSHYIDYIWQKGMKARNIITMELFDKAFEEHSLITAPNYYLTNHLPKVTTTLDIPFRIRFIVSIPVPHFYSTLLPKHASIEGVRLHESAQVMSATPIFDSIWQSYIQPYLSPSKSAAVDHTPPPLLPDAYCLTFKKSTTSLETLAISCDHTPTIIKS